MTDVADNLPGYMQYLDLIRDCIALFSLKPLPPNQVETQHVFERLWGRDYVYAAEDDRQHSKDVKSVEYNQEAHMLKREKERERRGRKKKLCAESEAGTPEPGLLETVPASQRITTAEQNDQPEGQPVAGDDSMDTAGDEGEDEDEQRRSRLKVRRCSIGELV
jgi:hypothetical protein